MKNPLVAGSRDSALALAQTRMVMAALAGQYPSLQTELKTFKTQGDIILDTSLALIGGKGLFVKELELALLAGEIDFAVHSMKDMPAEIPEGLTLMTFGPREISTDAFVSRSKTAFADLPPGAIIGTSSLRRQAMLKRLRPKHHYQMIRGNVPTRLKKLDEGQFDAIVLAVAGLNRLGLSDRITHVFSPEEMPPACCQGTLAIEVREDDIADLFRPFVVPDVAACTQAERGFLRTVQGGCQVPMAAYAQPISEGQYRLQGMICDPEGQRVLTAEATFTPNTADAAGQSVAQDILNQGGREILAALLHASPQG